MASWPVAKSDYVCCWDKSSFVPFAAATAVATSTVAGFKCSFAYLRRCRRSRCCYCCWPLAVVVTAAAAAGAVWLAQVNGQVNGVPSKALSLSRQCRGEGRFIIPSIPFSFLSLSTLLFLFSFLLSFFSAPSLCLFYLLASLALLPLRFASKSPTFTCSNLYTCNWPLCERVTSL